MQRGAGGEDDHRGEQPGQIFPRQQDFAPDSSMPVPLTLLISATPSASAPVALVVLILFTLAVFVFSAFRSRQIEINYSTD